MKFLFVYGYLILEKYENKYYHNFLPEIIERYKCFGKMTICSPYIVTKDVKSTQVNLDGIDYFSAIKENTVYHRFINRTHNTRLLKKLIVENDFLIIHTPSSLSNLAAKIARKHKKPYMSVTVGCVWDALVNHSVKGKLLAPIEYYFMRKTIRHSNYVVYVTRDFLQKRYPSLGQTLSSSDVSIHEMGDIVLKERKKRILNYNVKERISVVTIAAVDNPYKGQEYVIKAIAQLNQQGYNFHYYLIGSGSSMKLEQLVTNLGIGEYVHFLGGIPHEDIFSILNGMDLYIQPSRLEALPRALIEAMSLGMPCFATNVGGIPELLDTRYLFNKGSISEITRLLLSTKDELMVAAETNFFRAKKYLPKKLNDKRNTFFLAILKELNNRYSYKK